MHTAEKICLLSHTLLWTTPSFQLQVFSLTAAIPLEKLCPVWKVISVKNTPHQFYCLNIECTGRLQNVRVGYKTYGAGEFLECMGQL